MAIFAFFWTNTLLLSSLPSKGEIRRLLRDGLAFNIFVQKQNKIN